MRKYWQKLIGEEVSPKHKADVMAAARGHLKQNAARAAQSRRALLPWGLGAALAGLVALVFVNTRKMSEEVPEGLELWASAPEAIEEDLDLLADLELMEDLEILEEWEQS